MDRPVKTTLLEKNRKVKVYNILLLIKTASRTTLYGTRPVLRGIALISIWVKRLERQNIG